MGDQESAKFKIFGQELELHGAAVRRLGLPALLGVLALLGVAGGVYAFFGKPKEIQETQLKQGIELAAIRQDLNAVKSDVAALKTGQDLVLKAVLAGAGGRRADLAQGPGAAVAP